MLYDFLIAPFVEFGFMRRALVALIAVALMAGPIGVFLQIRRMSLIGDAMAHAVLPGIALGFLLFGLNLWAMTVFGLAAGIGVAWLAGVVARLTPAREESSLAAFYLISLAIGVLIVSLRGSPLDLIHILFGSLLAISASGLLLVAGCAALSLVLFAAIYRTLLVECFDPGYARAIGSHGALAHMVFMFLVVLDLVAAMQALGTLMAVGLIILPAAAARFWWQGLVPQIVAAGIIAFFAGFVGLLVSYHGDLAPGPSIVLMAGLVYLASVALGPAGGLRRRFWPGPHLRH